MDFERAKKYLESFVSYEEMVKIPYGKVNFDLDRVRNFLKEYGVDYEKLKYVHVAGSKGKGSVCSMIADYLWRAAPLSRGQAMPTCLPDRQAGYKVGLYMSPHMVEVTERFWLNGENISKVKFAEYVEDLEKFMNERCAKNHVQSSRENLTYFEILTVIALKFFVDEGVDYAVLEVGLGGRLDATNIVRPVLSVITSIELEHVGVLGNNLSEIVDEKLGIVKDGVPVLIGYQGNESLKLIRKKILGRKGVFFTQAMPTGRQAMPAGRQAMPAGRQDFDTEFLDVNFDQARIKNAIVAFAALKIILGSVDLKIFRNVVEDFKLPGRFDVRKVRGQTVVFDMAHTKSSVENLAQALTKNFKKNKFVFLMAIVKGKDVQGILRQLDKIANKIVFTNAHESRGILAKDLQKIANDMDLRSSTEVIENYAEAYESLLKNTKKNQILVVTGSHFLVGKLLPMLS